MYDLFIVFSRSTHRAFIRHLSLRRTRLSKISHNIKASSFDIIIFEFRITQDPRVFLMGIEIQSSWLPSLENWEHKPPRYLETKVWTCIFFDYGVDFQEMSSLQEHLQECFPKKFRQCMYRIKIILFNLSIITSYIFSHGSLRSFFWLQHCRAYKK